MIVKEFIQSLTYCFLYMSGNELTNNLDELAMFVTRIKQTKIVGKGVFRVK